MKAVTADSEITGQLKCMINLHINHPFGRREKPLCVYSNNHLTRRDAIADLHSFVGMNPDLRLARATWQPYAEDLPLQDL